MIVSTTDLREHLQERFDTLKERIRAYFDALDHGDLKTMEKARAELELDLSEE